MPAAHTCAICGKPMDPNQRRQLHIINRAARQEKHAHPECVTRDPARAKAEGFLPESADHG
jgi:hypothetical protein